MLLGSKQSDETGVIFTRKRKLHERKNAFQTKFGLEKNSFFHLSHFFTFSLCFLFKLFRNIPLKKSRKRKKFSTVSNLIRTKTESFSRFSRFSVPGSERKFSLPHSSISLSPTEREFSVRFSTAKMFCCFPRTLRFSCASADCHSTTHSAPINFTRFVV